MRVVRGEPKNKVTAEQQAETQREQQNQVVIFYRFVTETDPFHTITRL